MYGIAEQLVHMSVVAEKYLACVSIGLTTESWSWLYNFGSSYSQSAFVKGVNLQTIFLKPGFPLYVKNACP